MFRRKEPRQAAKDALRALADALANTAASNARHHLEAHDAEAGMTMAELDHFVHVAMSHGAGDNTPVMVRTNGPVIRLIWTGEDPKPADIEGQES